MTRWNNENVNQNILESWSHLLCKQDFEEVRQLLALKNLLKKNKKTIDK